MGGDFANNKAGHEFKGNGGLHVLPYPIHSRSESIQKNKTRMEKALMFVVNYIFPGGYGLYTILNINNFKGVMLTFLAVVYWIVRMIFYVIKQDHERRMRNLDYEERRRELYKDKI